MDTKTLQSIKEKLELEKKKTMDQIAKLKENDPLADPGYIDDNAAIDTDVREQQGHDVIVAEISTLEDRARDIAGALKKIEKGSYGYCTKCNKKIPDARLALIPEAQYCVDCEKNLKI